MEDVNASYSLCHVVGLVSFFTGMPIWIYKNINEHFHFLFVCYRSLNN